MNEGRSYIPPVGIGEVMRGFAAGRVVASNFPGLAVGDHVSGMLGIQEFAVPTAMPCGRRTRSWPRSRPTWDARHAGDDGLLRTA